MRGDPSLHFCQTRLFLNETNPSDKMGQTPLHLAALRDHPFKTSACLRGEGVKNLPNLLMDSCKKLPTVGGLGSKIVKNLTFS